MLTPEIITKIIVLSAIVVPIIQAIKKWLKAEGKTALIISAVVAILFAFWNPVWVKNYIRQSSLSIAQLFYLGIDYYLYEFPAFFLGVIPGNHEANLLIRNSCSLFQYQVL